MATPIWNDTQKKWVYRVMKDYKVKCFTSTKPGIAGKREVLKRYRAWSEGDTRLNPNTLVSKLWEGYLGHLEAKYGINSVPLRQAKTFGTHYILPAIGNMKISSVTYNDYQNIINTAEPKQKGKETLSKKYLKNLRSNINLFIKYCVINDYAEPLKAELYIPSGHPTYGKEVLQPEDVKRLFYPRSNDWYYPVFTFGVCTGMRPGEILGLQLTDYDGKCVTVRRSVNYQGIITEGKNKNAQRVVPLHPIAIQIIEETIKRNTDHKLYTEWIFCGRDGSMGNQLTMRNHWNKIKKERNLPGSPYSFRHTFISMVKNTMPEQLVKTIVGHSVNMDSFGVYGHTLDGELQQAAEIMDLTFKSIEIPTEIPKDNSN